MKKTITVTKEQLVKMINEAVKQKLNESSDPEALRKKLSNAYNAAFTASDAADRLMRTNAHNPYGDKIEQIDHHIFKARQELSIAIRLTDGGRFDESISESSGYEQKLERERANLVWELDFMQKKLAKIENDPSKTREADVARRMVNTLKKKLHKFDHGDDF